jgi:hypothetical protein
MNTRERAIDELTMPKWKFYLYYKYLDFKKIFKEYHKRYKWGKISFFHKELGIRYNSAYADSGSTISIDLYLFGIYIFISNKYNQNLWDPKGFEISYYSDSPSIYVRYNQKYNFIYLPWSLEWYRTSVLKKDGEWEHETKGNRKDLYDKEKWKDVLFSETHDYTYITKSGDVQKVKATLRVKIMEWRRRGWMWSKFNGLVKKEIEVDFSEDIGEGRGTYKGGVVGTGYIMLENETPLQTLRRMEREKPF